MFPYYRDHSVQISLSPTPSMQYLIMHFCVLYTLKGFAGVSKSPPYARDMWAFGQLVVAIVTRMGSNSDNGLLDHTKSCLLNDDPEVIS